MNHPEPDNRRNESDREDIMREATAMRRRVSLAVDGLQEPVVAGFRSNDFFSIYFDQDPVYQFNNRGQLRRAYRGGFLYRTQGNTLARLERTRTEQQTVLQRTDLEPTELQEFVGQMRTHLDQLRKSIETERVRIVAVVPADEELVPSVLQAINGVLASDKPLADALPTRRK